MPSLLDDIVSTFRAYNTAGLPASGAHDPNKTEIIALLQKMVDSIEAAAIGGESYATVADLPAPQGKGEQARVYGDPDSTKNGIYVDRGSWAIDTDFYHQFAVAVQPLIDAVGDQASDAQDKLQALQALIDGFGATTIPRPLGAHKGWRFRGTGYNGPNAAEVGELILRGRPGGPNLATRGTAFGSVGEGGDPAFGAAKAFDGNPGTAWIGGRTSADTQLVLGYIGAEPFSVAEFALTAQSSTGANAFRDGTLEYSDDTTTGFDGTWTPAWSMSGQTGWAGGETRTFPDPLASQRVRKVALVDPASGKLYFRVPGQDIEVPATSASVADPLAPVIQRRRLKAATYYGAPPSPMSADPITISVAATSQLSGGLTYPATDPMVRLLGGTPYIHDPFNLVEQPSYVLTQAGAAKQANTSGTEILLPPGVTQVEWYTLDAGAFKPISIMLDGVLTNAGGYVLGGNGGTGAQQHVLINLPASTGKPRRLRIWGTARRQGGFVLQAGSAPLLDPTPRFPASIVWEGDSITEGSVASILIRYWIMQASLRLGIDNPIDMGVGSSGFISRRNGTGTVLLDRLPDVLTANTGGPPDALVVAAGINDSQNSAPAVQAAALAYFQQARADMPDATIVAFGPWSGPGGYAADTSGVLVRTRDAIFDAAAQVQRIDTVDVAGWVTADNTPLFFNSDGNGGWADGPHPNDAGHAYYGQRAAAALADIFERY